MDAPSFCCTAHKRLGHGCCFPAQQPNRTELDAALHELGMLSAVTKSRKEYLKEKQHVGPPRLDSCLSNRCKTRITQMNSDFVTNFAFPSCVTTNDSFSDNVLVWSSSLCTFVPEDGVKENCFSRKIRSVKTRHLYKPYDFPWRPKLVKSLQKRPDTLLSLDAENDDGTVPPALSIIARQDSGGNKSNPGSPVKSQKPISSSGCSIVRSRSLDDLEIGKLNLSEGCSNEASKADIDCVSQWINNLHVS